MLCSVQTNNMYSWVLSHGVVKPAVLLAGFAWGTTKFALPALQANGTAVRRMEYSCFCLALVSCGSRLLMIRGSQYIRPAKRNTRSVQESGQLAL